MGTDIHGVLQSRYSGSERWFTECEIVDDRNYTLFAILAGVRNGYGFAGVYRHEPVVPIAEGRGHPEDFKISHCPTCYESGSNFDFFMGDHNFTWMTLDEITSWDGWDKPIHFGDEDIPARECCGTFLAWVEYAKLKTAGKEARIVIGFDS